ncbi:MAG: diversity-generating retroelement protein Avd [Deltaproteobacteria bacterium]|nr:diversity-generating retroelement protein Avd [Deltaproteobacteria bacterium]
MNVVNKGVTDRAGTLPIFTKTFDFITWLINATKNFPRSQRFLVTKRLVDAGLNFQERLIEANTFQGRARLKNLDQADAELDKVRLYLRLAAKWAWLSTGQYEHAAGRVAEIGRILGGWKRIMRQPARG